MSQFYTAPTAIRSLMKFGDDLVKKHDLSTLKVSCVRLIFKSEISAILLLLISNLGLNSRISDVCKKIFKLLIFEKDFCPIGL